MGWLLLWVWIGIRILFVATVVYFVIVEVRRYRRKSSQPKDEL
jgi:heme/copper-type cytochrome/quinol oxidase subunit 2